MQLNTKIDDMHDMLRAWGRWHPVWMNARLFYPSQIPTRRLHNNAGDHADRLSTPDYPDSEIEKIDHVIAYMLIEHRFDANLLVEYYREEMESTRMGKKYKVHSNTIWRWLQQARAKAGEIMMNDNLLY